MMVGNVKQAAKFSISFPSAFASGPLLIIRKFKMGDKISSEFGDKYLRTIAGKYIDGPRYRNR